MAAQELSVLIAMVVILFVLTIVNGLLYLRARSHARYGDKMLDISIEECKVRLCRQGTSGLSNAAVRAGLVMAQLKFAKKCYVNWWEEYQRCRCYYLWKGKVMARLNEATPMLTHYGLMDPAVRRVDFNAPFGTPVEQKAQNPLRQLTTEAYSSSRFRFEGPTGEQARIPELSYNGKQSPQSSQKKHVRFTPDQVLLYSTSQGSQRFHYKSNNGGKFEF